jgi:hypothetical protein
MSNIRCQTFVHLLLGRRVDGDDDEHSISVILLCAKSNRSWCLARRFIVVFIYTPNSSFLFIAWWWTSYSQSGQPQLLSSSHMEVQNTWHYTEHNIMIKMPDGIIYDQFGWSLNEKERYPDQNTTPTRTLASTGSNELDEYERSFPR